MQKLLLAVVTAVVAAPLLASAWQNDFIEGIRCGDEKLVTIPEITFGQTLSNVCDDFKVLFKADLESGMGVDIYLSTLGVPLLNDVASTPGFTLIQENLANNDITNNELPLGTYSLSDDGACGLNYIVVVVTNADSDDEDTDELREFDHVPITIGCGDLSNLDLALSVIDSDNQFNFETVLEPRKKHFTLLTSHQSHYNVSINLCQTR